MKCFLMVWKLYGTKIVKLNDLCLNKIKVSNFINCKKNYFKISKYNINRKIAFKEVGNEDMLEIKTDRIKE